MIAHDYDQKKTFFNEFVVVASQFAAVFKESVVVASHFLTILLFVYHNDIIFWFTTGWIV